MPSTKNIKQKIKATTSIKKITKTMEMVAVSKMKKSVKETLDLAEYISEIKYIIQNIKAESKEKHLLFDNSKIKTEDEIVIIFASNKGLCGSFNSNVYKKTKKLCEDRKNNTGSSKIKYAICFGKFSEKIARKLGLEIKLSFLEIEKLSKPTQVSRIEKYIREMYLNQEVKQVHAVYTNFVRMGVFEPRAITLYPISKNLNVYDEVLGGDTTFVSGDISLKNTENPKPAENYNRSLYVFEPSISELIEKTVPKIIKMILFSFVLESRASENSSRSFAMKRASDNASEMMKTLKIRFNRIRQDSITQEIAEISAGAGL